MQIKQSTSWQKIEYTSVWNNGFKVISEGKMDINTRKVYGIEDSGVIHDNEGNLLKEFVEEYITVNKTRLEVRHKNNGLFAENDTNHSNYQ